MTGSTVHCRKTIQIRHALEKCENLSQAFDLLESYGVSSFEADEIIRAWIRRQNQKMKGVRYNEYERRDNRGLYPEH